MLGAGLLLLLVATEWGLLRYAGLWIPLAPGVLALLGGITAFAVLGKLSARGTPPSAETAETDRMMGRALQGQGQLDMAFERLRRVPPSDALMDKVDFSGADFRGAVLRGVIATGSNFHGAQIRDADFSDALLDREDVRALCREASGTHPVTGVATRDSLGCG